MGSIVYIAEKPSVAQALSEFLGANIKTKHFYKTTDEKVIITWLYGHVLELVDAQDYDEKYKKWLLGDLPIIPNEFKLRPAQDLKVGNKVVIDNSYKRTQLKAIADLIKNAEEVCVATDPDSDGELLGIEVVEYLNYKGKITRVLPTSLDTETIRDCINTKKMATETVQYYEAGLARSHIDWTVGINVTRGLTAYNRSKINSPLNSGRVQTNIIGLLYENELSRKNFKPVLYYSIEAFANIGRDSVKFKLVPDKNLKKLLNHNLEGYDPIAAFAKIQEISEEIKGKDGIITSCEKARKKTQPKLGYKLSDLQVECSKKLALSASETLAAVQKMYEAKYVSYPRTDCAFMPERQQKSAGKIIANLISTFTEFNSLADIDPSKKSKAWNDKKIENHHAIIPTSVKADFSKLSPQEIEVYNLIAKRYLIQFLPDYEYHSVSTELQVDNYIFKTTGNSPIIMGWKAIDTDGDNDGNSQSLPTIGKGSKAEGLKIKKKESKTTKPKPYTEADFLLTLVNAHKLVRDKELAENMKKREKGIGTQATTAKILAQMKKNGFYQIEKKKYFELTEKGRLLAQIAPRELTNVSLTAQLEYQFAQIENKELRYRDAVSNYNNVVSGIIANIKDGKCELSKSLIQTFPCVHCDYEGVVQRVARESKKKFWICLKCQSFYDDKYGKPVPKNKPVPKDECPKCHKTELFRYESKVIKGGFGWFCGTDGCSTSFPDRDGKPDFKDRPCKKCNSSLVKIFSKKTKKMYWVCPDKQGCKMILPDLNGEPNYDYTPPVRSEHKCTKCGGELMQRTGKNGKWWGCINWNKKGLECKATYTDIGDRPDLTPKKVFKCPQCGGNLAQRNGRNGKFWGCMNWNKKGNECNASFDDRGNEPIIILKKLKK